MRKTYLLFFLLLTAYSLSAQDTCACSDLIERGGVGMWAQFSLRTDMIPYNGICFEGKRDMQAGWKKYENGYIIEQREYVYNGVAHYTYKEIRKDSVISIMESYSQNTNKLQQRTVIYEKNGQRYRMEYTYMEDGRLMELSRDRYLRAGEGKAANAPAHVFNKDGYYYSPEQDGPYLYYGGRYGIQNQAFPLVSGQYLNDYKTGYWYEKYENGKLKSTGWYVRDRHDSLWTTYYQNGIKESQVLYRNGGKTGTWKKWDYEGNLVEQIEYRDGVLQGLSITYYPDGKIASKQMYGDGYLNGKSEKWYVSGNKESEYNYRMGQQFGQCRTWFENGQLKSKGVFINNTPEKFYEEWFEDGKIALRRTYANRILNDSNITWFADGKMKTCSLFKDGLMDGTNTSWYANGKKEKEEQYKAGKKNGVCSYWNSEGILIRQINYAENLEDGAYKTWNEKGQLITEYNYSQHIRHGRCRRWDANGNLVFDRTYAQGKGFNFTAPESAIIKTNCAPDSANPFSVCESNRQVYAADAALIALDLMQDNSSPYYDSIIIPEKLISQIELILINVYNGGAKANPEIGMIHHNSAGKKQAVYSVNVRFSGDGGADPEWITSWKNGKVKTGNPELDKIISENGLVLSLEKPYTYSYETSFTFVSASPVNAMALDRALKKFDKRLVCYGHPGGYAGDHITIKQMPRYTCVILSDQLGEGMEFYIGANTYTYYVYPDGEVDLISVSKLSGDW